MENSLEAQLYKLRKDDVLSMVNTSGISERLAELQHFHNEIANVRGRVIDNLRNDRSFNGEPQIYDSEGDAYLQFGEGEYGTIVFNENMGENDMINELSNYEPFVSAEEQLGALEKPLDLLNKRIDNFSSLGIHGDTMRNIINYEVNEVARNMLNFAGEDRYSFIEEILMDKGDFLDDENLGGEDIYLMNFTFDGVNSIGNYMNNLIQEVDRRFDAINFQGFNAELNRKFKLDDFMLDADNNLVSIRDAKANQALRRMAIMFPPEINDKILGDAMRGYIGGRPPLADQLFLRPMDANRSRYELTEGDKRMIALK